MVKIVEVSVLDPSIERILHSPQQVKIRDEGGLVESVAAFDRLYFQELKRQGIHKNEVIDGREARSILHLIWNPAGNILYPNIGLEARGPNREFLPLKENLEQPLPSMATLMVTIDAGC